MKVLARRNGWRTPSGKPRYLRKARKVLHALGRDAEWDRTIADIREKNARKRRLLEILDRMDKKRIIEG
jgi:hypothetical protein